MRFFAYMAFCLLLPCALVADDVADDDKATPETAESDADGDVAADGGGLDSGFERFKTILDRMPFGRPPPGFDPDSPGGASGSGAGDGGPDGENAVEVSEMEQQILSSVRVSALNVTPAGIVTVGFTDSSVQPPRNYFMEVGEKRGEWTVVEADPNPEKKTVKLSKNGVEATLKLGGSSPQEGKNAGASPNVRPALSGKPGMRMPIRHMGMGRMGPVGGADDGAAASETKLTGLQLARARQEKRRMEMEAEAAQRRQAIELAQKEREQAQKDREQAQKERELAAEQAQKEREMAAEERKAQLDQLKQIQEELRRQREERLAEEARRAASGDAEQP